MTTITTRTTSLAIIALVGGAFLASMAEASHGCRIHASDDVMATRVRSTDGGLEFTDLSGHEWELVTSTTDPAISNAGSGSFHAATGSVVEGALAAVAWPGMSRFDADIFLLPYPRRELLPSSAGKGAIYVSPGVHPWSTGPLHALVVHEMGHLVHERLLPDTDVEGWKRYRQIRGITDESVYRAGAAHRNRPHEIFAEDFRALFGGPDANYSHSIENPDLVPPDQVPGLYEFMAALAGQAGVTAASPAVPVLTAAPNPFHDATVLSIGAPVDANGAFDVAIVDVSGRLVVGLGSFEAGTDKVGWNGRDAAGRAATAGVYYAVVTTGRARGVTRLVLVR
ncbi:MAG TPA: T9SS type A sorting domain-containing protein [Candidatus Eisenbacteria bacterium]